MPADPKKLKKTKEFSFKNVFFCVDRLPNSSRLFFGSSDFGLYELDAAEEKPEPFKFPGDGHESYVTGVALCENVIVSGSYDQRLIWWDIKEHEEIRTIEAHARWIRQVVASPDGSIVASVADDMLCKLWDAKTGKERHTLKDHKPITPNNYPSMLYAVAFSPDGKFLATGDKVGHVAVWDVTSGKKVGEVETPVLYTWDPSKRRHSIGGIRSLAFSHDSRLLAVGGIGTIGNIDHLGAKARIEMFDWKAGKRLLEFENDKFKGLVEQIEFHPSNEWFVAAGGDHGGFIAIHETKTGKVISQEKAPMHIHGFVRNESFDTIYAVGHERIAIWELKA